MGGRGTGNRSVGRRGSVQQAGTLHLQGIGDVPAMAAGDLKAGDHIMYNYGVTAQVVRVEPSGKQSVKITTQENGKIYYSTKRTSSLVASDAVMGSKDWFAYAAFKNRR